MITIWVATEVRRREWATARGDYLVWCVVATERGGGTVRVITTLVV